MIKYVGMLTVIVSALSGCAMSQSFGAGMGSYIGNFATYPVDNYAHTEYQIDSQDFSIVGQVECSATAHNILWLVSFGDSGYAQCMKQVEALGGDALIDVKRDIKFVNILFLVYGNHTTKIHGTAIKWKKKAM